MWYKQIKLNKNYDELSFETNMEKSWNNKGTQQFSILHSDSVSRNWENKGEIITVLLHNYASDSDALKDIVDSGSSIVNEFSCIKLMCSIFVVHFTKTIAVGLQPI